MCCCPFLTPGQTVAEEGMERRTENDGNSQSCMDQKTSKSRVFYLIKNTDFCVTGIFECIPTALQKFSKIVKNFVAL
jgi:hypothetical protein